MAMSTGEMVQRAKVRALSEGLQVYRIAPDAYVVPSKSKPGEAYEVLIINGDLNALALGLSTGRSASTNRR